MGDSSVRDKKKVRMALHQGGLRVDGDIVANKKEIAKLLNEDPSDLIFKTRLSDGGIVDLFYNGLTSDHLSILSTREELEQAVINSERKKIEVMKDKIRHLKKRINKLRKEDKESLAKVLEQHIDRYQETLSNQENRLSKLKNEPLTLKEHINPQIMRKSIFKKIKDRIFGVFRFGS